MGADFGPWTQVHGYHHTVANATFSEATPLELNCNRVVVAIRMGGRTSTSALINPWGDGRFKAAAVAMPVRARCHCTIVMFSNHKD